MCHKLVYVLLHYTHIYIYIYIYIYRISIIIISSSSIIITSVCIYIYIYTLRQDEALEMHQRALSLRKAPDSKWFEG